MPAADTATLFTHSAPIDRAAPTVDARMEWPAVPAKNAVYLLTGPNETTHDDNHPYLLATVGNLRAALQRRLADTPEDIHSKRIQYGKVCTRVHWRIVHSPFAANFYYLNAARFLFPDTYRQMIAWRPTWWIALERDAPFPKLRRTDTLSDPELRYAGPIRDKTAAGKLIETLEDLFDLCRYHHILLQAPHGKPCAYKEMGKCPAPCDGSVPMSWYLQQSDSAFRFLTGESRLVWTHSTQAAMKQAATNLEFEQAAKIKERLSRATFITAEPFAHLAPLEDFAFLALQPGQGKPYLEPWLIHPCANPPIRALDQLKKKELPAAIAALFQQCQQLAAAPIAPPIAPATTEQLSLVAHHLFKTPDDPGIYLRLKDILAAGPQLLLDAATGLFARNSPPKPLPENASDKIPTEPVPPFPPATNPQRRESSLEAHPPS